MKLTFRDATPDDAKHLSRLAVRAKASWGYPEAWIRAWHAQLSFSADYIQSNTVIVADLDGTAVGVIALEDHDEPEIGHLWVAPEHSGLGIGRKLVQRAVGIAASRGWRALRIESDPNARPFYEHLGAVQVGEVKAPVCGTDRSLPVLRLKV